MVATCATYLYAFPLADSLEALNSVISNINRNSDLDVWQGCRVQQYRIHLWLARQALASMTLHASVVQNSNVKLVHLHLMKFVPRNLPLVAICILKASSMENLM
jgi:hypothetical protein